MTTHVMNMMTSVLLGLYGGTRKYRGRDLCELVYWAPPKREGRKEGNAYEVGALARATALTAAREAYITGGYIKGNCSATAIRRAKYIKPYGGVGARVLLPCYHFITPVLSSWLELKPERLREGVNQVTKGVRTGGRGKV